MSLLLAGFLGAGAGWASLKLAEVPCLTPTGARVRPRRHRSARRRPAAGHRGLRGADWAIVALGAIVFAVVASLGKPLIESMLLLGVSGFLLTLTVLDLKHQIVPNRLVYPAVITVLGGRLLLFGIENAIIALCAGLGSFLFFALVAMISPGGLGGGDVKLAALVGVLCGFPSVIWALTLAILAGGIVAIALALAGRREGIPYAPYLCLGAWAVLLWDPLPWLLEVVQAIAR